ncbi:aldo/keto reductase [Reinekea sp.]|uniref:aldo/keto reductase n=1 Tax=Reinekea sp. TaxID=1970455 RepID=UPI00257A821E|nr:aldo/keto reductase [Reinekea sp.]
MKTRILTRSGLELTELGFGAAGIGNLLQSTTNRAAEAAVTLAWENGIRYFDSAPHYGAGLSERRLGSALHDLPADNRVLSTKVGRVLQPLSPGEPVDDFGYVSEAPFKRLYDYSYAGVMTSFEASLQRLGVASVDLLLMHDIGELTHGDEHAAVFKTALDGGYAAMAELRSQGRVKAIGLGVNEWQVCAATLAHTDFDCFLVANCFTLLNNSITQGFTAQCDQRNIDIIAAAPFNSGILATGSKGAGAYFYGRASAEILTRVQELEAICATFGVSLPAAAIQFPLRYDSVKSVVVGMTATEQIQNNIDCYNEPIANEFWQELIDRRIIGPS